VYVNNRGMATKIATPIRTRQLSDGPGPSRAMSRDRRTQPDGRPKGVFEVDAIPEFAAEPAAGTLQVEPLWVHDHLATTAFG
jgi:hypothetical protein